MEMSLSTSERGVGELLENRQDIDFLSASLGSAYINNENEKRSQQLGKRSGKPDARIAQPQREAEETGGQQDEAAQQGDDGGILGTLHALEVADGYDVDGKKRNPVA